MDKSDNEIQEMSPEALHIAAEVSKNKGDIKNACVLYKALIEKSPIYALYYANFVRQYAPFEVDNAIDVLKSLIDVTASDNHKNTVLMNIGLCYDLSENYSESAKYYHIASNCGEEYQKIEAYNLMKVAIINENENFSENNRNLYDSKHKSINTPYRSNKKYKDKEIGETSGWHKGSSIKFFPLDLDPEEKISNIIYEIVESSSRLPDQKIFNKESKIVTLGSCFANNLRAGLIQKGIKSVNISIEEALNNTSAVNNFISWSLTGCPEEKSEAYQSHDGKIEIFDFGNDNALHKDAFVQADGIIITYGVGEVWTNQETGGVFWHGVPASIYDRSLHSPIITSALWNAQNIRATISCIRKECGDVPIFLTVSPVPLNASFRDVSIWEADCASKSAIRAGIEEVMGDKNNNVYYWPSFEIVRWIGAHVKEDTFSNKYANDGSWADARHVRSGTVNDIIKNFIEKYFAMDE